MDGHQLTPQPGEAPPSLGATTRTRTIKLLAAVEATSGLLATRGESGQWSIEPLPDRRAFSREGLDLAAILAALPGWLAGPDTPSRFTVDLPTAPLRTFLVPRRGMRRLAIYRIDPAGDPRELLLVPCDHAKAIGKSTAGYLELLGRHTNFGYAERPSAAHHKSFKTWENLADELQHGLLLCDGDMIIRYINPSAREHLGLAPGTALGSHAADLPWDPETKHALRRPYHRSRFNRQAQLLRDSTWVPVGLNGVAREGGGMMLECLVEPAAVRASNQFAPLGTAAPPVASPQPAPQWVGPCAVLPVTPRPGTVAHQRLVPLGGGAFGLRLLHIASDDEQWRPWAQQVAGLIESEAHPLQTAQEVLTSCIQRANLPLLGELPWGLGYGRLHADHRSFDFGFLGDAGLLIHKHGSGWRIAEPDRAVYAGYGCPSLRLYSGELLPGEGLWLFAHSTGASAEHTMQQWSDSWPSPFPKTDWSTLRDALQDPQIGGAGEFGGGMLVRQSGGVQEECLLFPPQFATFANTLRMRLKARGADEHILFQVRVALDEILSNAFRHGHGGDYTQPVRVRLLLEEGCLRLSISDKGPGFDPLQLRDPTLPEAILENGGRGVFLAAQMMDALGYGSGTNEVVLTKYFHPTLASA